MNCVQFDLKVVFFKETLAIVICYGKK